MSHPPNRLNAIRLVKGQTKNISVKVRTQEGRPVVLSGETVLYMSVRRTIGSPVLISKQTGSGIEVTDPAKGEATVVLDVTDTEQLETGVHRYDVWLVYPSTDEVTPDERFPLVRHAELVVEDSITQF
jgi:hypothetical protein